jgi:carbon monoxide dehydrogenase subunit G
MEFKGKYTIPASPNEVWTALHDPEMLAACIPGCEKVEKIGASDYQAIATLKIGPVKARFQGKVQIEDAAPPTGVARAMRLSGEGQGGAAGFARGQSEVHLTPANGTTILQYSANAIVGGKLAQIGQRLIDGAAKSIADDFFGKFSSQMQARHAAPAAEPVTVAPAAPATPPDEGLAPQVWVAGLIGIIVILLIFFSIVL